MFDQALQQVLRELRNDEEEVHPPATENQIAVLISAVHERWHQDLPDGYLRFLRTCNGIDYNGLVIYGAGYSPENETPAGFWQGLLAANQVWHDEDGYTDLLIFADDDTLIFANSRASGFGSYDRGAGDLVDPYSTFDDMLFKALKERL